MITSYLIIGFFAIFFLYLSLFIAYLIRKNMHQGTSVRNLLQLRVDNSRMANMLTSLDLDYDRYIYDVSVSRINQSIDNCDHCDATEICDQTNKAPEISLDKITFCPNHDCLSHLVVQQQKAG